VKYPSVPSSNNSALPNKPTFVSSHDLAVFVSKDLRRQDDSVGDDDDDDVVAERQY